MPEKNLFRTLAGLGVGIALAVGAPLAASAHVTIDPGEAEAGSWIYATVRVPNESDTASTTRVDVTLPADTPFTSVRYSATPGWTTTVTSETLPTPVEVSGTTITEAPRTISFVATGEGVVPGAFQTFQVSLGPVPDTGHIVLPAAQTYSDGSVVEWAATPDEAAHDEAAKPAPVLWVNDEPADSHHGGSADAGDADHAADDAAAASPNEGLALGLSITALVLGAGALLLAAVSLARRRKVAP